MSTSRLGGGDNPAQKGKTFKACRVCRKQKLRCGGRDEVADGGCERCRVSGVRCIFDVIAPRKRKRPSHRDEDEHLVSIHVPGDDHRRSSPHSYEVMNTNGRLPQATTQLPAPEPTPPAVRTSLTSPITIQTDQTNPRSGLSGNQATGLTSKDLQAPVSALHNMSTPGDRADLTTKCTTIPHSSAPGQPLKPRGGLFGRYQPQEDLVSKGVLDQSEARKLFNLFMTSASNFVPIFDPVQDTFDTMRRLEPFCFAVVLALAYRIEGSGRPLPTAGNNDKSCLEDLKILIADSLFQYPASLGDVQAMVLLAAYSEKTWFAIGHALQMATDLDLDKALMRLDSLQSGSTPAHNRERRQLVREARIWLAICFMEREIAIGMVRPSRTTNVRLDDCRWFTDQPQSRPSDMRLTSLMEAVQIRNDFHADIASATDLASTAFQRLKMIDMRFQEWIVYWDNLHEEYGYDELSFQRVSLQGQKNYAIVFLGCSILGRLKANQPLSITLQTLGEEQAEVPKLIISTVLRQLDLVLRADSYKWNLKWATNYTALSLTFTTLFALEISRVRGDLIDAHEVLAKASQISDILKRHYSPLFHRLIQLRINERGESPDHPDSEPNPSNEPWSSHSLIHGDSSAMGILGTTAPTAQQAGNGDPYQQSQLTSFLEDSNWMTDPSSMLAFDLPDIGNITPFENGA